MRLCSLALLPLLIAAPALAKSKETVVVPLRTSQGQDAGTATFKAIKGGSVELKLKLKNLPPGEHGVHIHERPVCTPPDFKTAGGHFNPTTKQHGFKNPAGPHAGDTPNSIEIGEDHMGQATYKLKGLTMNPTAGNSIFANGGTSVIVHAKADDEVTDPSGNSGNRIACGVIPAPLM